MFWDRSLALVAEIIVDLHLDPFKMKFCSQSKVYMSST